MRLVLCTLVGLLALAHATPPPPPADAPEPVSVPEAAEETAPEVSSEEAPVIEEEAVEESPEEVVEEEASVPEPPPPPPPPPSPPPVDTSASLPKRGLNRPARFSQLSKLRPAVKPAALGGLALVATVASAFLMKGKPKSLEEILVPVMESSAPVSTISDSPYWIDRQLDKLEAWLKRKFGKSR